MKIIPNTEGGEEVSGMYVVMGSTIFGEARLFGPATLAECERYVLAKIRELGEPLVQQIKNERARVSEQQRNSPGMER